MKNSDYLEGRFMKVFSVAGYTKSGKTTTIEYIIKELKKRNYSVGSIKDIHFEGFAIDTEGTNTHRHKVAGAELVTARGLSETDILFQRKLDLYEIAKFYQVDYLVVEGVKDANIPMILTADCLEDLDERYNKKAFLISGKIADTIETYKDLDAISALQDIEGIVDRIEARTFPMLPDFDPKCCSACGYDCRILCEMIVAGDKVYEDCAILNADVKLKVNGKSIKMVPFVQQILRNTVEAVVKELDGYSENALIEIELGNSYNKES
jgi:molybdopterin-guanine dinucleotide biosynthesis protein B